MHRALAQTIDFGYVNLDLTVPYKFEKVRVVVQDAKTCSGEHGVEGRFQLLRLCVRIEVAQSQHIRAENFPEQVCDEPPNNRSM